MKKTLIGMLLGMFVMISSSAFATTVQSQFFSGLQQWSDNSAEYLLNLQGDGSYLTDNGDTIITTGDRLRGMFDIQTIEDLTGILPDNLAGTGGVNQFTGVFEADVIVGGGPGAFTFDLRPSASFEALYGTGAMIALFQSPTLDFNRLGGPDDIPGAVAEESLIATATHDGSPFLVFGFADWANAGNLLFGEGWFSTSGTNDVSVVGAIPPPGNGGTVNFGLNLLSTTLAGYQFNLVGTSFGAGGLYNPFAGGTAQLAGSSNLLGLAGVNTPFDVFDNTDLVVNVSQVPEPGTIVLLGLGLLGIGVYSRKRIKN